MMSTNDVYGILYRDSKCNHSPEILQMLMNIILKHEKSPVNNINRWNIYMPSSIHIVYTTLTHGWNGDEMKGESLICQISEFESEYRQYYRDKQLNELGI